MWYFTIIWVPWIFCIKKKIIIITNMYTLFKYCTLCNLQNSKLCNNMFSSPNHLGLIFFVACDPIIFASRQKLICVFHCKIKRKLDHYLSITTPCFSLTCGIITFIIIIFFHHSTCILSGCQKSQSLFHINKNTW